MFEIHGRVLSDDFALHRWVNLHGMTKIPTVYCHDSQRTWRTRDVSVVKSHSCRRWEKMFRIVYLEFYGQKDYRRETLARGDGPWAFISTPVSLFTASTSHLAMHGVVSGLGLAKSYIVTDEGRELSIQVEYIGNVILAKILWSAEQIIQSFKAKIPNKTFTYW